MTNQEKSNPPSVPLLYRSYSNEVARVLVDPWIRETFGREGLVLWAKYRNDQDTPLDQNRSILTDIVCHFGRKHISARRIIWALTRLRPQVERWLASGDEKDGSVITRFTQGQWFEILRSLDQTPRLVMRNGELLDLRSENIVSSSPVRFLSESNKPTSSPAKPVPAGTAVKAGLKIEPVVTVANTDTDTNVLPPTIVEDSQDKYLLDKLFGKKEGN